MNKKGQMSMGGVVMIAVALILAAVFISQIADQQSVLTNAQSVSSESFSLTSCYAGSSTNTQVNESVSACNQTLNNIPSGWQVGDSAYNVFSVVVTNSTGGLTLVADTDYNLYGGTGVIQYLNTSDTEELGGNVTLTSYSYYDTGYNKDAGARGISRTFTLWFALIALGIAAVGLREWIQTR